MVPDVAAAVRVDLVVPHGDAVGMASATSMVGVLPVAWWHLWSCCQSSPSSSLGSNNLVGFGRTELGVTGAVVVRVRRWWQEGFVDGKSLTEMSTRLAGAGVDYAFERRLPRWGASPWSFSFFVVFWLGGAAPLPGRCVLIALLPPRLLFMLLGVGWCPLG
jgi:hypothetical protein